MKVRRRAWTNDEDRYLNDNYDYMSVEELAKTLRRTDNAIKKRSRILGLVEERVIPEYAVYKGDDLIVMGNAEKCAERMNVTKEHIRWMTTPAAKKRIEDSGVINATTAVKI